MQLTALSPQILTALSPFGAKHNPQGGKYNSGDKIPCKDRDEANKLVSEISLASKKATPSYQNGGWVVIVK
jgi:hypothetical protein